MPGQLRHLRFVLDRERQEAGDVGDASEISMNMWGYNGEINGCTGMIIISISGKLMKMEISATKMVLEWGYAAHS